MIIRQGDRAIGSMTREKGGWEREGKGGTEILCG
jgi:hypothetical protein